MNLLEKFKGTVNLLEKFSKTYNHKNCLVTGGASFIGSHLVDTLLHVGANVKIIDDFSSGKLQNLDDAFNSNRLSIVDHDIVTLENVENEFKDMDYVFNLAAVHGGRGFIESHGKEMLKNLMIDQIVFKSAVSANTQTVVHASSACAYPIALQSDSNSRNLLQEKQANFENAGSAFPDGVYGWTKLMGEFQLKLLTEKTSTRGRAARIFTAYGPRENESHAAIALIAKSYLKMDPFEIWGTGEQTRNFTYVADTVAGLILGSQDLDQTFYSYNIGTSSHVTVNEFTNVIFTLFNWNPNRVNHDLTKPAGVGSRASNNQFISNKFGWQPTITIQEGLTQTIDWYLSYENKVKTIEELFIKLNSR